MLLRNKTLYFYALLSILLPIEAWAQLAPLGDHYGGRLSDTGYMGQVNASGGYQASVPLNFPAVRGGLPLSLSVMYQERGVGAAGLGWDIPQSYIQHETTLARHRPVLLSDGSTQPRDELLLVLNGKRMPLVQTTTGWVPQHDAPEIEVRQQSDGSWIMYDGHGLAYSFKVASSDLDGVNVWMLTTIADRSLNRIEIAYSTHTGPIPGIQDYWAVDLSSISYNFDVANRAETVISLGYTATTDYVSMFAISNRTYRRKSVLSSITTTSSTANTSQNTKAYQLSYASDADNGLPRLDHVQLVNLLPRSDQNEAMPIAAYKYGSASVGGQLSYQPRMQYQQARIAHTVEDDSIYPSVGHGFVTEMDLRDLDGDGKSDFIQGSLYGGSNSSPVEVRTARDLRYDQHTSDIDNGMIWRQLIDVDGDGRLDVVNAHEQAGAWVVYLNVPDAPWGSVRRLISTDSLLQYFRSRGLWTGDDYLPLALRSTVRDLTYSACVIWSTHSHSWNEYWDEDTANQNGCPPNGRFQDAGPERTVTQWEFKDVNGDGYPDVVSNSAPLFKLSQISYPPPLQHEVNGLIAPTTRAVSLNFQSGVQNDAVAMFNVLGVHLGEYIQPSFSSPVTLWTDLACGIGRWAPIDDSHQQLACDISDVNGDGIADLIINQDVHFGVGQMTAGGFFAAQTSMSLPGALAVHQNNQLSACAPPALGTKVFTTTQLTGMRDLNGDGIPDYISSPDGVVFSAAIGTGRGFGPALAVNGAFNISQEIENCAGTSSITMKGLFDIDGDGSPDSLIQGGIVDAHELIGSSGGEGAPEAGRLLRIDNGYGASTNITYMSAKQDTKTKHRVPFPEIVVRSVQTTASTSLPVVSYAYGDADLTFDPISDAFQFAGYRRQISMQFNDGDAQTVVNVTDAYAQNSRADPYGILISGSTGATTESQRYLDYYRRGRVKDETTLVGAVGNNPWLLLDVDTSTDARRIAGMHYDWASKSVAPISATSSSGVCWEMTLPYDYVTSSAYAWSLGWNKLCSMHGLSYVASTTSWQGDPGSGRYPLTASRLGASRPTWTTTAESYTPSSTTMTISVTMIRVSIRNTLRPMASTNACWTPCRMSRPPTVALSSSRRRRGRMMGCPAAWCRMASPRTIWSIDAPQRVGYCRLVQRC